MPLTVQQIRSATADDDLFQLLSAELQRVFPPKLSADREQLLAAMRHAPRGLRAMASIYQLDVSMALDDLAWHFVNHRDIRTYRETLDGLRELGADNAASLFEQAHAIVEPHWDELCRLVSVNGVGAGEIHDWLDRSGIQGQIDPLNDLMYAICSETESHGLLRYWISYARKHPENCVGGKAP